RATRRRVFRAGHPDRQRVRPVRQPAGLVEDLLVDLAGTVAVDRGDLRAVEVHVGDAVVAVLRGDPADGGTGKWHRHTVPRDVAERLGPLVVPAGVVLLRPHVAPRAGVGQGGVPVVIGVPGVGGQIQRDVGRVGRGRGRV